LLSLAVVTLSASAFAQATADEQKLIKRIPAGYSPYSENDEDWIKRGDLNGDGADDYALLIDCGEANEFTRRTGVMVFFKDGGGYKLAAENFRLIAYISGVSIDIGKGNLYIKCSQYGSSYSEEHKYTFRYKNSEFELIGYDFVYTGGSVSVNFPARKKLEKDCPSGKKCKETWTVFTMKEPILLRKLADVPSLADIGDYMKAADGSGAAAVGAGK